jgi:hypothetical protein
MFLPRSQLFSLYQKRVRRRPGHIIHMRGAGYDAFLLNNLYYAQLRRVCEINSVASEGGSDV